MLVDAISIPVVPQAVSTAARATSSVSSSFSATLASSLSSSAPESSQDQATAANLAAAPSSKLGVKAGTVFAALGLNSKFANKSDAKPNAKPTPNAATAAAILPALAKSVTATSPLLVAFEKWNYSASTLANPSNQQPVAAQLAPNLASPAVLQVPPVPLPVIAPANVGASGTPPSPSDTQSASSSQSQPSRIATSVSPLAAASSTGGAPLLAAFEKWDSSASTPDLANLPTLSDFSNRSNQQPVAAQLAPNLANVSALQPAPVQSSVAVPTNVATSGTLPPSASQSATAAQDQPSRATPSTDPLSVSSSTGAGASSLANFDKWNPTEPTPDVSNVSNSSDEQPVVSQLAANLASVSAFPPTQAIQAVAVPAKIVASGTPPSNTQYTSSSQNQPSRADSQSPTPASADSMFSLPNLPAQPSTVPAQFVIAPVTVSLAPTFPVSAAAVSPRSASPNPAQPRTQAEAATLPANLPIQAASSSVPNASPVFAADSIFNVVSRMSSAPALTPTSPQPPSIDYGLAAASTPPSAKPLADPEFEDTKIDASTAVNPAPVNSNAAVLAPAPGSASVALGTSLSSDGTAAAAVAKTQTDNAAETAFVAIPHDLANSIVNNMANNPANGDTHSPAVSASNFATNPNVPAPAATAIATSDVSNSPKSVVPAAPAAAAVQQAAADKKSAVQPVAAAYDAPSPGSSSHNLPATTVSTNDSSATLIAPVPTASVPSPQPASDAAPNLPQTHQMLDSAPAPAPPAANAPGSLADLQTNAQVNAQMHVGLHTDAFGSVEIHTVVQQSQVGITVHSDRDISRWFNSEVPGLESGLNRSHLNLTAVNFDNDRSGVQTATSFQNGQPRQGSPQTVGSQSAGLPGAATLEPDIVVESSTVDILPSGSSAGSGVKHVSIHV